jgi:hypothetical protein
VKFLKQQHNILVGTNECVLLALSGGLRSSVLRQLVEMVCAV